MLHCVLLSQECGLTSTGANPFLAVDKLCYNVNGKSLARTSGKVLDYVSGHSLHHFLLELHTKILFFLSIHDPRE